MARDYKDEYKKFQSSPSSIKKRVKLNKINRDKGTYGNNDGKDNSHVKNGDGTVIIVVKNASDNRGSKSDMPGDKRARGVSIMKSGGIPTDPPNDGKKKPNIKMNPKGDIKPKVDLHKANKVIAGKGVPRETNNLLQGLFEAQKDLGIKSNLKQIPKNLDINSKEGMKLLYETFKDVNKDLEFIQETQDQNKLNNMLKQVGVNQKPTGLQKLKGFMSKGFKIADKILRPLNPFIIPYDGQFLHQNTPPVSPSAKGSRVYKNKYFVTAGDDNEFGDKSNIDSGSLRTENIRKASSGAIYSRGFDYYGGGPLYGQSAGNAAIMGGTNTAAALGAGNDGSGKGGGGGLFGNKRKDAKVKEKGGTTVNERRALKKAKKAIRVASREERRMGTEGRPGGPVVHAKKNMAVLQEKIQNDTFSANDNVKPWFKSKKSWEKDNYNRINSTQKQKEKWEKANPDKKWEAHGGSKYILAGSSDLKYYTGKKGEEYSFGDGTTRPFRY